MTRMILLSRLMADVKRIIFLEDEILEYTIRFQNLGNAEAIHVVIVDTLDSRFDIQSFEQTNTSHDVKVHIEEDSILIMTYTEIYLPAEEQDEEGSNGTFSYRIKLKENQELGAQIRNRAAIYFDFNDPVITNTVTSTLIDDLPQCIITSAKDISDSPYLIYPNPAQNYIWITDLTDTEESIRIYDAYGRNIHVDQTSLNGRIQLDIASLRAGVYYVKVIDGVYSFYKE